jgi:hypothetical protein
VTVWVTVLVLVTVDGTVVVGVSVLWVTVTVLVLGTGVPVSVLEAGVPVSVEVLGAGVPASVAGACCVSVMVWVPCVTTVVPLCPRCVGPADVPGAGELLVAVVAGALLGVVVAAGVGVELEVSFSPA